MNEPLKYNLNLSIGRFSAHQNQIIAVMGK